MFYSILVSHVATVPETLVVDAAVQGNIHSSLATQGSNFVDLINPRPEGYDSHFVTSFVLFTVLQRAALSSRQLKYQQAKHVDGLQSEAWIHFRSVELWLATVVAVLDFSTETPNF